ncbi:MAG: ABC transporter ATP-binding protein [Elainellaceae cyanobacterium]
MHIKLFIPIQNLIKSLVKTTSFWKENALVLREFRHFRWIAISALIFSIVGAALEGTTVGLIASFLQGLTNPSAPPLQTGISWFDTSILATEASASERIYRLSGLILVLIWARAAFSYLSDFYSKLSALKLVDRLRKSLFEQLQSLSLRFYATTRSGELINSIRGEVNQIQQAFIIISVFVTHGLTLLAYLVSMVLLSWQLTVASVLIFGLLSVSVSVITRRVREASFEVPAANKDFTSTALSFIDGIRTVHASATQEYERQRFYRSSDWVFNASINLEKISILVHPLIQGMTTTMLIGMVVFAFNFLIAQGQLQAASLLTFLFALTRTTPLVSSINQARTRFSSYQGSFHSINELLRRDNKPYLKDGKLEFKGLKQSIDFVAVDFGYNPNEPVLHDITLSIQRGQTTALVGSSGAGKTTLADLIPRFYDPVRGQIFVDGVDLRDLRINSFRKRMAIVSQDTFIFNASARDNIAYGVENVDEEAVREAARSANALDFIMELPEGFDTVLGDRGVRLSGGQRQRIAIARALLRNPDILILDEATSALDSVTERLIQESLERLSKGRTVIAIAHRLSTIVRADKVVVLEQGRVVEQGRYQELLEQRGKLWKYHQMQYEVKKG